MWGRAVSLGDAESATKLRRSRDALSISGRAIVAFGLWDIARAFLSSAYGSSLGQNDEEIERVFADFDIENMELLAIIALIVLVLLFLSIFLRFHVGLAAHSEARGKKKGWGYVVLAAVMALNNTALAIVSYTFLFVTRSYLSLAGTLITSIIDLTSIYAYVDLIRSAITVKRLTVCQAEGR